MNAETFIQEKEKKRILSLKWEGENFYSKGTLLNLLKEFQEINTQELLDHVNTLSYYDRMDEDIAEIDDPVTAAKYLLEEADQDDPFFKKLVSNG